MLRILAPLTGLARALAAYRLYRWWNTAPRTSHVGQHRARWWRA